MIFLRWSLPALAGICGAACLHSPSIPARPSVPSKSFQGVSLLGRPLYAEPPDADRTRLEHELDEARRRLDENPGDPDRVVWVGRRLGYLWRMNEAIAVYTDGIRQHADFAPLYRHRGHRYISVRRFDDAIADLQKAAALIEGRPDEIEPDGAPNPRNIPLTTLGFNVWYHLGVARYLTGDFQGALDAFRRTMNHTRGRADNVVAVTDWMYMALRRLGRHRQAAERLEPITTEMEIIENHAYFRRCLMYKGAIRPEDLLDRDDAAELDPATLGYGLGNWYRVEGDRNKAIDIYTRVTSGPYWPAFGFIAAEADLAGRFKPSSSAAGAIRFCPG